MTPPPASTRTLQTADERREAVLESAVAHFARRGYWGTPTTDVARDAGISQAYLFRLFPTKQELFITCVQRCQERIRAGFERAAAPHAGDPEAMFSAMGKTYETLLADRDLLLVQLHSYASCDEPAVREAVRDGYRRIVETVQALTGADEDRISDFFAYGMLITVVASMGAHELDEPWARALMARHAEQDC